MNTPKLGLSALAVVSILFSAPAFAVAGKFQFVNGEVQVLDASGKARTVKKGDAIDQGETVSSGANGFAQIRMEDGGFFAVRPETEFKIDTFKYEGKEDGSEKGIFSLVKGSLRSVTGVVGKKHRDNYKINTATATIGIRGSGADAGTGPNGTAVRTLFGGHTLTSGGKTIVTGPGQTAFAPPGAAPQFVPNFPFNTSTTGGGNNNNSGGNENGDNSSQNNANNDGNTNPGNTGNNDKVVIPIVDTEGALNFTNLTQDGASIGGGDGLSDPTGTPGLVGSGGVTIGLVQYTNMGNTYTYAEQGVGVVDNSEFFSYTDANYNLVGWKSLESYNYNGQTTLYKDVVKLGSATVVQDGYDAMDGVIWGRWTAGWESAYSESHNGGKPEVFHQTPVGGLAFISAAHITNDAELLNYASYTGGGLTAGNTIGSYSIAPGNFPTALNGIADGGSITGASATVNFSTGHITNFSVSGSGGAFGTWSVSTMTPTPISDFKSSGITTLTGSCNTGTSASCMYMGGISGRAVGTFSGSQAQGIISTVGVSAGTNENVGGAVYLKR